MRRGPVEFPVNAASGERRTFTEVGSSRDRPPVAPLVAGTRIPETAAHRFRFSFPHPPMKFAALALAGWLALSSTAAAQITIPNRQDVPLPLKLVPETFDVRVSWLGKHTLFLPPLGFVMRAVGGIPVVRHKRMNLVQQVAERDGFRHIFLLNGHGGNHELAELAARDAALRHPVHVAAGSYWSIAWNALIAAEGGALSPARFGVMTEAAAGAGPRMCSTTGQPLAGGRTATPTGALLELGSGLSAAEDVPATPAGGWERLILGQSDKGPIGFGKTRAGQVNPALAHALLNPQSFVVLNDWAQFPEFEGFTSVQGIDVNLAPVEGSLELWRVEIEGRRLERLTRGRHFVARQHLVAAPRGGARLAVARSSATTPPNVAIGDIPASRLSGNDSVDLREVTDIMGPAWDGIGLVAPVERWHTVDGRRIQGWFYPAPASTKRNPAPAVVEIHGGPATLYGWSLMWEWQVLAANGISVYACNPRGSQGYGQAFLTANVGDWGDGPMADFVAARGGRIHSVALTTAGDGDRDPVVVDEQRTQGATVELAPARS